MPHGISVDDNNNIWVICKVNVIIMIAGSSCPMVYPWTTTIISGSYVM